ncbi:MAG: ABC transporter ATP-binding protein [Pseudomonadota bacterium]
MSLEVRHLVKHFGGVKAVDGVSFRVEPGECVALIGPNGAGKSTCFSAIAGQYPVTSGEVLWEGEPIHGLEPAARLRRGVARTFQVAQVFEALTAAQNVELAVQASRGPRAISMFRPLSSKDDGSHSLLKGVGLEDLADAEALSLPYGAKKRLELAIALASQPRLLLLDEPAAGLAEAERGELVQLFKRLASQGMAVLYTEHNMDAVQGVADRVLVLIEGQLAAQGSFEEISKDPMVRQRYLGEGAGHA